MALAGPKAAFKLRCKWSKTLKSSVFPAIKQHFHLIKEIKRIFSSVGWVKKGVFVSDSSNCLSVEAAHILALFFRQIGADPVQ